MADALTPHNPNNMNPALIEAGAQDAGQNIPGATIQVPQVLAKYRKIMLFTAASLMLVGFISLVLWSSEKPYRAVYAGMAEKEAAAVVELLQKERIPYRLEGSGTIMVPEDQVYQVRLKLAGQGVNPSGNTGFEIFDQSNEFGLSSFTRKINLQRALQGELARTIEVMPQINAARVHLVLPKESAFANRDRKATASVMLQLVGGQRLPKKSVIAIQNLVSASIPDLDQSNVTIVDASGTLLSSNEKEAPMSEGQSMQEYQAKLEQRMEQRLSGMLEQIVGAGQAVVRVSADINREFIEQNNTRYNPDEQVLRSRKSTSEQRSSASSNGLGVPGLASNTPGGNQVNADGSVGGATNQPKDNAKRSEEVNNYEISSTQERRIIPFGSIKKLSVATIVGGHYATDADGVQTFTARSKEELANLQKLIERAMGYNEDRGDSVSVQSMALVNISSDMNNEAFDSASNQTFYMQIARYSLAALALLLLAWFVLRPLATRIQESNSQDTDPTNPTDNPNYLSDEAVSRLANMEQVKHSIHKEPDRANKVLREWIDPA